MKKAYFLFITFTFFPLFLIAQSTGLEESLNALLKDELLETSDVGIAVYDLTAGESLYNYQHKKLYRPASVQKLITAIAGVSLLGADYPFTTSLYYKGELTDGILNGDLYVVGGFDAEFAEAGMDSLVNMVVHSGIHTINGRVIGDVSMTDSLYWGSGWCWDDTPSAFQPYLSPLLYNKGYVEVGVTPAMTDSLANITVSPFSSFYKVDNQTISKNVKGGKLEVTRDWLDNGNTITIKGNVTSPYKEKVNMYTSKDFFMHTFCDRLQQRGISTGTYVFGELLPDSVTTLLGSYSHLLTDLLNPTLKKSDNLGAEAIFYHLAAHYSKEKRNSAKEGVRAIEDFINYQLGIKEKKYRIADGSGLSPYNYVSPELLIAFLKYAYEHKSVYETIWLSLPIAGIDGSLQYRLKEGKAYKNVRAKTGTVTGVCSLAGYAKAANGHLLAFVIINQNMLEARKARVFQNKVCEELCK